MSCELRYHPSAEQTALANAFNESIEELLPLSRLHLGAEESERTWSSLESLGLFGMCQAEEQGGSGLGPIEESLIVMQLGRCLAAPSVFATIGAVHVKPLRGDEATTAVQRAAAAYRNVRRTVLVHDDSAPLLLLRDGSRTALYRSESSSYRIDEQLWLGHLRECRLNSAPLASFDAAGLLRLRLLDAAALSGIAETALRMSVAYSMMRNQFGRPIGSFQAVKHHCANMAVAARRARDQTSFAAVALEDGRKDAALQLDCALLMAGGAALENSAKNIQIHGGMGFSDEADPHLLLKRTQLMVALAGGLEAASSRIADAPTDEITRPK